MKKQDFIIILCAMATAMVIDFDKNAIKALISGGVFGKWIAMRFLNGEE